MMSSFRVGVAAASTVGGGSGTCVVRCGAGGGGGGGGGGGARVSQSPLIFSFSATFKKDWRESCVTLTCEHVQGALKGHFIDLVLRGEAASEDSHLVIDEGWLN